jgi:putative DNA primase/helicase
VKTSGEVAGLGPRGEAKVVGSSGSARPLVVRLSEVPVENVEWVWPGRIPKGRLTLLAGDPGCGKTFLSLDLAARASTGAPWPDEQPGSPPENVIVLNAEDAGW